MKKLLITLAAAAIALPAAQAADRVVSPDDRSIARATSLGPLPKSPSPDAAAPPRAAYLIQGEAARTDCEYFHCWTNHLSIEATTAFGGSGVATLSGFPIRLDCVAVDWFSPTSYNVWATGRWGATSGPISIWIGQGEILSPYFELGPDFRVDYRLGDGPCDSAADARWDDRYADAGSLAVVLAGTNTPPTARFTSSCSGLTCTFDGRSSSDADAALSDFRWRFGDRSPDDFSGESSRASGRVVSHTYAAPGTYSVALIVRDDAGAIDSVYQPVTVG